jgi:hypothetical protein
MKNTRKGSTAARPPIDELEPRTVALTFDGNGKPPFRDCSKLATIVPCRTTRCSHAEDGYLLLEKLPTDSDIHTDRQDHGRYAIPLEPPLNCVGGLVVKQPLERVFLKKHEFSREDR